MSVQAVCDKWKNSMVRGGAALLCTALIATGCSGGGGGGSATGPQTQIGRTPIPRADDNPNSIFPGPGQPPLKVLKTGQGSTSGFINVPGDIDYFRMELVGGSLYALQVFNFPETYANSVNASTLYGIRNATGAEDIQHTGIFAWPTGVDADTGDKRFVWLAPYTGTYYVTVQDEFLPNISQYTFRLTSSQVGFGVPRESSVSNRLSHRRLFTSEGDLLYDGPTPFNRTANQPLSFLFGSISQPTILITFGVGGGVVFQTTLGFTLPDDVFFLDAEGGLNEEPESPAAHLHWGVPSGDLADGIDDIVWNFDPQNPIFNIGPNYNARPNLNFQDGDGNPIILDITDATGDLPLTEDLVHLLMGNFWYIDGHFHDQFDVDAVPLVSSRSAGGVEMFESRFVLNGFETVPPTGSGQTLEVFYSDEHQAFFIQYGVNSSLAGNRIHVHKGAPGTVGSLLIDLGTIPFPAQRPVYEPEILFPTGPLGTFNFIPGVENVIKRITNSQARALKTATFTTGWYLDVHTSPLFETLPLIRSDAVLFDNWEVVATNITSFVVAGAEADESEDAPLTRSDLGPVSGTISFASEGLVHGPVVMYLDGAPIGQIDIGSTTKELVCGVDTPGQSVVVYAKPGTYSYHASADGDIYWEGEVTIADDDTGCTTIVLTESDAVTP